MPKVSPLQSNFNGGELSPLVLGRVEQAWYKTAYRAAENYVPLIQGGLASRPGTYFTAEVKDSTKSTRLVRFEFSTTQAYVIEFGDLYNRFYKNNAQITLAATSITGATQANPVVITANAHGLSNGDRVVIISVGGMTQLNNREFTVAGAAANTFQLSGINGTAFDAYTSGGTVAKIYEIAMPYAEADLFQLKFTQSADTLYIVHPSYAPRKLTRSSHTSWTPTVIDFLDGPYLATNTTATTLALSALTGSVTVTASAPVFTLVTDVGRLIRWKDPAGNWTWLQITAVASTTSATATIRGANASAGTATVDWRLGTWSATTGYPSCVTFHEDRLTFGGPTQRVDLSKSGDYENFAPTAANGTVADNNAIALPLNSSTVDVVRWVASDEKGLLVGTVGGEWLVRASTSGQALTPATASAKRSTPYGSANLSPVRAGRATLFLQRAGRAVRELAYVFEVDGFRAPNITVRSAHITGTGIKEMAYQAEPQSLVWLVRNDGVLVGITYDREQDVVGWHKHVLGGVFGTGDAVVESVTTIPSADGTRDEVWLIVKRTVNGSTKRYVEYMTKFFDDNDAQEDAFFVDCGLTYDGAPTTTISSLNHLEGRSLAILADGATHPMKTVTAGKITLDRLSSVVQVGESYQPEGQLLRPEAGSADGTAQGKTKRTNRVTFRLHRSLGLFVGSSLDGELLEIIFRESSDDTNTAVPLFTGDKSETFEGDYDTDGYVCFKQRLPLPSTILAVMPQLVTNDR